MVTESVLHCVFRVEDEFKRIPRVEFSKIDTNVLSKKTPTLIL